ncbi:MAG: endonuclease domain-containing protein [Candidatus Marinimicrobia bacterium]|nr:endonuclease domain-containing protein [Candidatus Neomarinimicrobiota bacterium]
MKINNPTLKRLRRHLRNNPTPWEHKLWQHLKGRQLDGLKFRRQTSIGKYIVDFYCPENKLIVEVDGGGHFSQKQKQSDQLRQKELENEGFIVLRYLNTDIDENIAAVLDDISQRCSSKN